ncbi:MULTISPECIES: DUF4235 domain-containing protein [unclassified Actinotalea]|uniref:DUF4235 domain-containing protein n=1 Tax=unclassified Actinotalea TaxID=2638618 RepID=UPI0015F5AAEE|nr:MULTISPECIES: DUF4235 domain-containing protein [unclassified Actinotalea]
MESKKESWVAKAVGLGFALGAAWLANQLIDRSWNKVLGHKPPKAEDPGDARVGEVLASAAISGAIVALARVLATRGAAKIIR